MTTQDNTEWLPFSEDNRSIWRIQKWTYVDRKGETRISYSIVPPGFYIRHDTGILWRPAKINFKQEQPKDAKYRIFENGYVLAIIDGETTETLLYLDIKKHPKDTLSYSWDGMSDVELEVVLNTALELLEYFNNKPKANQ